MKGAVPYLLVVAAAWAGGWFFAAQAEETAYEDLLESCNRVNITIRVPLYTFATSVINEDDLSADIHRSARTLRTLTAPVRCEEVVHAT